MKSIMLQFVFLLVLILAWSLCITYAEDKPVKSPFDNRTENSLCPDSHPVDCDNGWCCRSKYPVCGDSEEIGVCFSIEKKISEKSESFLVKKPRK